MWAAVDELKALILSRYPGAQFRLAHDEDDASIVYMTAVVDIDDPDEVTDLVIDRTGELLVQEGIPLFVVPIRTPERVAAMLATMEASAPAT